MNNVTDIPMVIGWSAVAVTVLIFWRVIFRESRRIRAKERFEKGMCVKCGYDLRASQDRCPECGFPIEPPELPLTMPLQYIALQDDWPTQKTEPRQPESGEDRVEVYCSEAGLTKMLVDQFESRGISAIIRYSSVWSPSTQYHGGSEYKYGTVSVWSGDVDRSIKLIRGFGVAERHRHVAHHAHSVHSAAGERHAEPRREAGN